MKIFYIIGAVVVGIFLIGAFSLGPLGRALVGGDPFSIFEAGVYTIGKSGEKLGDEFGKKIDEASSTESTAQASDTTTSKPLLVSESKGVTLKVAMDAYYGKSEVIGGPNISDVILINGSGNEGKSSIQSVRTPVQEGSDGKIRFQYFVDVSNDVTPYPAAHCSDIRLNVDLDEKPVGVTQWLGFENRKPSLALDTGLIAIDGGSGKDHVISIYPEGRISGCNESHEGFISAWGGTLVLFS